MPSRSKIILSIGFIISLLLLSFSPVAAMDTSSVSGNFTSEINSPAAENKNNSTNQLTSNQKIYLDKLTGFVSIMHISSCLLVGESCTTYNLNEINSKLPPQLRTNRDEFFKYGLIGVVGQVINATYAYPPASLSFSISQALNNLNPVPKAVAQNTGLGFSSLAAFSSFWSVNRNLSYSFIVVALLFTGFMLIFRYKIDPNTSIDLERIISKTILVILIITLSYAIAGFLIDLMYLSLMVIFYVAKQNHLVNAQLVESIYGHVSSEEIFQFITQQTNPTSFVDNFLTLIPNTVRSIAKQNMTMILFFQLFGSVASAFHDIFTFIETQLGIFGSGVEFDPGSLAAAAMATGFTPIIASLIVNYLEKLVLFVGLYLTLLFLYFKILFILIGSYIDIVFSVIFAPFLLLADIFPGKNHFSTWIKRLIANILTFPLLALLFLAGGSVTNAIASSTNTFLPPPLAGMTQAVLASLVGIGILLAIPNMIDRMKKSIVPEYTLVNFPTTPASIFSTVATVLPFLPTIIGAYSSMGHAAATTGMFKKVPGKENNPVKPPEPLEYTHPIGNKE